MVSLSDYHGAYCIEDKDSDKNITLVVESVTMFKMRLWYSNKNIEENVVYK